jgi:L-arabonate dehydrase
VVFEDIDDYKARINDDALDIDVNCVMVLKNCGPKGYPGMPEVGNMGLPPKLLKQGITDMVRIYGTVVLHTAPEAAAGGPIAVVHNNDMIELDVPNRRLHLDIPDAELAKRLSQWQPKYDNDISGYTWLHQHHVDGTDTGADLNFLRGCCGALVARNSH